MTRRSVYATELAGGASSRTARRALAATLILFAASMAALAVDYRLAQWSLAGHCPAALRKLCQLSEPFGHGIGVLAISLLVFQLDPLRRWSVPRLLVISLGAGVAADLVKLFVARVRPRHFDLSAAHGSDFSGWLPLLGAGHTTQSFPSGHTAVAVGLAFGLSWLYPRGRWIFVALAVLASCQRLDEGAHFLSDSLFGAGLGSLAATVCLYWHPVASLIDRREASWRASANSL